MSIVSHFKAILAGKEKGKGKEEEEGYTLCQHCGVDAPLCRSCGYCKEHGCC